VSSITIRRPEQAIRATVRLPRSKSISNRALICASLAGDLSCVRDLSDADDTRILLQLLKERPRTMHCGLGGTTFRFLLAWAAIQEDQEHVITGEPRLLERPHDDLVNALRTLGADIEKSAEGYRVRGRQLQGGSLTIDSPISSQYISALMMIAPLTTEGLRIEWKGTRTSVPYVEMTAEVMRRFGAEVRTEGTMIAASGSYRSSSFTVPPDWSAAAFWYEVVGLSEGADVGLPGLGPGQLQGDAVVEEHTAWCVLPERTVVGTRLRSQEKGMSAQSPLDLSDTPDLFPPLAALIAGRGSSVRFIGLETLAHKESDRMEVMSTALERLGCTVSRASGSASIKGNTIRDAPTAFDPHGDHRLAMALAPLALVCERITILDPDVVNKSYPGYWRDLAAAGFRLERS
jgi:3-phosphoshikimate 1-carboxyvinyltransferase